MDLLGPTLLFTFVFFKSNLKSSVRLNSSTLSYVLSFIEGFFLLFVLPINIDIRCFLKLMNITFYCLKPLKTTFCLLILKNSRKLSKNRILIHMKFLVTKKRASKLKIKTTLAITIPNNALLLILLVSEDPVDLKLKFGSYLNSLASSSLPIWTLKALSANLASFLVLYLLISYSSIFSDGAKVQKLINLKQIKSNI